MCPAAAAGVQTTDQKGAFMDRQTTNDLAIAVRDGKRHRPRMAETLQKPALRIVAALRQQCPDVPEEHVAAILLHLGNLLTGVPSELRRENTITEHLVSEYTAALVGIAGEEIHSTIQRRQAPSIKTRGRS